MPPESSAARLYASHEALDTDAAKAKLVESSVTHRTTVFDLVRGPIWPAGHGGRAVVNSTVEWWHGRNAALRRDCQPAPPLPASGRGGRHRRCVVWAGTGVSRIHDILLAGEIVSTIAGSDATQFK